LRKMNPGVELSLQIGRNRLYGRGRITGNLSGLFVSRPSDMGHEDDAAAPFDNAVKGPNGAVDPVRVTDDAALHHIMVDTDEYNLACQFGVLNQRELVLTFFLRHDLSLSTEYTLHNGETLYNAGVLGFVSRIQ
jgi:hypothetical protein